MADMSKIREMARGLVRDSIMEDAMAQFLAQTLAFVHDERIKPLQERADAAESTVATLTEQVEAMRVSAMKAMTIANGALDTTATEKTFRRDLVQIREELRGALWPAALTTENQTNG